MSPDTDRPTGRTSFRVDPSVQEALSELARREGVELPTVLATAFEALLQRYTLTPPRLGPAESFLEVLHELAGALPPGRADGAPPELRPLVFIYRALERGPARRGPASSVSLRLDGHPAAAAGDLAATGAPTFAGGEAVCRGGLFEGETLARFVQHFQRVLHEVAWNPERSVDDLLADSEEVRFVPPSRCRTRRMLLRALVRAMRLSPDDSVLVTTRSSRATEELDLLLALASGATVVPGVESVGMDEWDVAGLLWSSRVTVLTLDTRIAARLTETGWLGHPGLKLLCTGPPPPPSLARRLLARCGQLWWVDGYPEAGSWNFLKRLTEGDLDTRVVVSLLPAGPWILDRHGRSVPPGIPGELALPVSAPGSGKECVGKPGPRIRETICSAGGAPLLLTGELARELPDGRIHRIPGRCPAAGAMSADEPGARDAAPPTIRTGRRDGHLEVEWLARGWGGGHA